ncbi:MAG: RNA polymerase sigma factor [Microthrixaceae bacterium]
MSSAPDPSTVAAARVGAGWAFERLYQDLSPAVLGYVRSQGCGDPEGTVSDVFLRVFRRLAAFEGSDAQLRSWVFTIAHNVIVDERRSTSRRGPRQRFDDHGDRPGGDAERDAMDQLGTGWVQQVLDVLSPSQRDVVLLRVVADLSLEEVAAATGRRVGAVKSLQHRALGSLRRHLNELDQPAVSPARLGRSPV